MPLGTEYARQDCSMAKALEIVGERWTLLILRDAFWGVRRFTDFQGHLDVSRAVLAARLDSLVADGLMVRTGEGHPEYHLTDDGVALWPMLYALGQWGERRTSPGRSRCATTRSRSPCASPTGCWSRFRRAEPSRRDTAGPLSPAPRAPSPPAVPACRRCLRVR
jgi:DNA-binding HxlR family transcriptional regulator